MIDWAMFWAVLCGSSAAVLCVAAMLLMTVVRDAASNRDAERGAVIVGILVLLPVPALVSLCAAIGSGVSW